MVLFFRYAAENLNKIVREKLMRKRILIHCGH